MYGPENLASRGSSEIRSCLLKMLNNSQYTLNKENLRFFSDSYVGQQKYMIIFMLYYTLVHTCMYDEIPHYFLVPGHAFLPSDTDFRLTEKKQERQTAFTLLNNGINFYGELESKSHLLCCQW